MARARKAALVESSEGSNPGGPGKAASRLHWLYVIPLLLFTVLVLVETLALGKIDKFAQPPLKIISVTVIKYRSGGHRSSIYF